MIKHWEIRHKKNAHKEPKYHLYIDGDKSDVIVLLTKLANLCSRPIEVESPYTFALPILESDPEILADIEKITDTMVKKIEISYYRKKKETSPLGKLQNPAKMPEPEKEYEVEEEPIEEEPETTSVEEEITASDLLEQTLEVESPKMPESEEGSIPLEEVNMEAEVLKSIGEIEKKKSVLSSEVTKYLDLNLRKMDEDRFEPSPPKQEGAENEPTPPIPPETEGAPVKPAAPMPSKTERIISVANIELNIPTEQYSTQQDELQSQETQETAQEEPEIESEQEAEIQTETVVETEPEKPKAEFAKQPYYFTPNINHTFDTLKPASNRFAHAAVMSATDSLGTMYNPLVLFGSQGTGKTHFLSAMYFSLVEKIGKENIFITDGTRLSIAIEELAKRGNVSEINEAVIKSQVLMIDDFHLVNVNEMTKTHLSKWLNHFTENQKQIVLTSQVSPDELEQIESGLDFWLNQGWTVELKNPAGENYFEIAKQTVSSFGINISGEEMVKHFSHKKISLCCIVKTCQRLKSLGLLTANKKIPQTELFDMLMGTNDDLSQGQFTEEELKNPGQFPTFKQNIWGQWAFFAPTAESVQINLLASSIASKMKEFDIDGGFGLAFTKEYFPENLRSASLEIFKQCQQSKIKKAFIIAPPAFMHEQQQYQQFCSELEHMFKSIDGCAFCMETDKLRLHSSILKAICDLSDKKL